MNKWALLTLAIAGEVSATLALRAASDHPAWFALTAAGYVAAFVLLAAILRTGASIGVVYGIWAACGVALTAVLAYVLFGDPLTWVMAAGIALVAAGVMIVETGSTHAGHPAPAHDGTEDHR
ncbi:DMT family transporter [Streptomyces anulatus]